MVVWGNAGQLNATATCMDLATLTQVSFRMESRHFFAPQDEEEEPPTVVAEQKPTMEARSAGICQGNHPFNEQSNNVSTMVSLHSWWLRPCLVVLRTFGAIARFLQWLSGTSQKDGPTNGPQAGPGELTRLESPVALVGQARDR